MSTGLVQSNSGSFERPAPDNVVHFLVALFEPNDHILVRPTETWTEGNRKKSQVIYTAQRWQRACILNKEGPWQSLLKILESHRANAFFGVCPRVGPKGQFDLSWQIRTVRVLWADLDHCTVEEAGKRCATSGLPRPSVSVRSGHGTHLYWLLSEPYRIDDVEKPPAVFTGFLDQGEGKKKRPVKYIKGKVGELGICLYLDDGKTPNPECPWGELSAKARHVQDVLAGLAAKIGGDHTTDLARCLRLPGTLNRKNERNGVQPVPCELVECEPSRRYPLADFEGLAVESPSRQRREKLAAIQLRASRSLRLTLKSRKREDRFRALVNACASAEPGSRSEFDWALVCWSVENGVDPEEVWATVATIGKFAERGRDYFDRTLAKAKNHTQEKIYDRLQARNSAVSRNGESSRNGTALVVPADLQGDGPGGPDGPQPHEGDGNADDDPGRPLPEDDTDPHRLAREWLTRRCHHARPGDCAAYYRQTHLRWDGQRWREVPEFELEASLNQFVRRILEEDARLRQMDQGLSDENEKPYTMPSVTKKLVSDVMAAIGGLTLVPQTVEFPSWRGAEKPGKRNWISFHNGILDVDALLASAEQVLLPHTPQWFSPIYLPYDFDPDADCPRWRSFLSRNLGDDPNKQLLLQQWAGYLLLPDTSYQRFLLMIGEGSNGKSVICKVFTLLLGEENVSSEPLEMFTDKFRLYNTLGKLANITAEVGELDKVAEGLLKAFVVGDNMSFERKYKQAFSAAPTARMMLSTNNMPTFSDKSDGIWRRMLVLPLTVQILEHEIIQGMDKKEYWQEGSELSGILNWALAGLAMLRQQGRFTVPQSCQDALGTARVECNPARRFLLENYQVARDGEVLKTELYQKYREWCGSHGHHPLADIGFGREVRRLFKSVKDGKMLNPLTLKRENCHVGLEPRPND
jgi:P4 family phage/plasmid primase-like protien